MKNIFLSLATVVAATFAFNEAAAQKLFFGYGHLIYAQPSGKAMTSQYNNGFGGEIGAGIRLIKKTYATGTVGYTRFFDKDIPSKPGDLQYIPVRLGLRQHFLPLNILFAHADFGTASVKNNITSGNRFTGSMGVGAKLLMLEVGIDYEFVGKKSNDPQGATSWVGFKAGYRLGL